MAQPQEFPFNIMDVAELLHLHIRRRQADSVYADCPICGDKRGKMNINFAKNLWRCNYCNEGGGMLALYGKVYGISNSEAYREICDTLQNGLTAPEYTVKELPEKAAVEQSALASPQEIHQTFSMLLELLTLSPQHRKHLQEVRGLTDEQIERLGYKSTPPFYLCRSLTEKLCSRGCKVEGVPGFYVGKDDKWTVNFNSITAGIIIPARGIDGMIRGAQIRLDTPIRDQESDPDKSGTKYLWLSSSSKKRGVSSGSPVHFVGDPFARVVYVTEGLLKADVAHYLMDRSFAATAGANNVNKLDMLFALLAANGTEVIIEAEDMDKYHNAAVNKGASKIYLMARSHGLECRRLTWDPNYKGIDDWQLAMRQKKERRDVTQMNFRTRFVCGLCSFDAISEEIAAWHDRDTDSSTLHDYLGLSEQEYARFLRDGDAALEQYLLSQRAQQCFRIYQPDVSEGKAADFAFGGIKALQKAGYEQPPASEYALVYDGVLMCEAQQSDTIYQRENILAGSIKPRWVMFQSRDDFATLSFREDAKATWQCSTLDSLDRIGGFDSKCAFYRQQDEARVAHFCKCEHSAISALNHLQWPISGRKALERKWKKQRAIIDQMRYVPALPRDFKGFIHRDVMPQYIFYDYQRKGPEHAFCTACRHEVSIAAAKHNTSGICPHCKKKIIFKSRGKSTRLFDRATVQVLQKTENGEMLLRIIKVYRAFTGENTPAYYSVYENARYFILPRSNGQCSTSPYYLASACKDDLTPWKCGYRPRFLSWYESFEASAEGKLYPNNLAEFLRDTPWKYSQLESYARTANSMEAITYLNAFARWPMIEYLVKLKLFRLAKDIVYSPSRYTISQTINCEGKSLQDVLGFDRSWIPLLQEVNPGIAQLRIIRAFIDAGKKLDASMMKWCADNAVQDASVLMELLSYTSMHKLCRYADAQYEGYRKATKVWYCEVERSMANLLTDYCDYLRMCKELQYDVKNSFILFPNKLKDAHDSVAKALRDKHTAEQEKAIADCFNEWQTRYQYQGKELMMIPPHSAKEIVDEGAALHHCVGHYLKNVAEKERVILFVRSVAEPDKSLCTVEVRDGQVTQARGFDNAEPPAQITAFIEQWKQRVLYAADKAAA